MQREPVSLWPGWSRSLVAAGWRSRLAGLARGTRSIAELCRAAHGAEVSYHELSRLCDVELARLGIERRHVPRLVYERLTSGDRM